jgi:hypothetical protein
MGHEDVGGGEDEHAEHAALGDAVHEAEKPVGAAEPRLLKGGRREVRRQLPGQKDGDADGRETERLDRRLAPAGQVEPRPQQFSRAVVEAARGPDSEEGRPRDGGTAARIRARRRAARSGRARRGRRDRRCSWDAPARPGDVPRPAPAFGPRAPASSRGGPRGRKKTRASRPLGSRRARRMGVTGLEPVTSTMSMWRSSQLSYTPRARGGHSARDRIGIKAGPSEVALRRVLVTTPASSRTLAERPRSVQEPRERPPHHDHRSP